MQGETEGEREREIGGPILRVRMKGEGVLVREWNMKLEKVYRMRREEVDGFGEEKRRSTK